MKSGSDLIRRDFLRKSGLFGAAAVVAITSPLATSAASDLVDMHAQNRDSDDIAPTEDLMREHGLLNRVLLIYENFIYRIDRGLSLEAEEIAAAAGVVRHFIEDYHERAEERYIFPRFQKARVLTELVEVLNEQHDAGRRLTGQIITSAKAATRKDAADRAMLAQSLRAFVYMYRPHEAREDTVLFPALRKIVTPDEFDDLGEVMEANDRKQLGPNGFERCREQVAHLEKHLGIYDLAQFTPQV
jgi:hemerythrin-like domain-containing protein